MPPTGRVSIIEFILYSAVHILIHLILTIILYIIFYSHNIYYTIL